MSDKQDLLDECYNEDCQEAQVPLENFKAVFCGVCKNPLCTRSAKNLSVDDALEHP